MRECNHLIGLWNTGSNVYNITLDQLKSEIKSDNEYIRFMRENHKEIWEKTFNSPKEKDIKYYCDRRRGTNLGRYKYCPLCGEKIDWERIKESDK